VDECILVEVQNIRVLQLLLCKGDIKTVFEQLEY
jgi:hypothetical protein